MKDVDLNCNFCNSHITVSLSWIKENGRVFCNDCCKSFPVAIAQDKMEALKEALDSFEKEALFEEPEEEKEEKKEVSKTAATADLEEGFTDGYYHFKLTEL